MNTNTTQSRSPILPTNNPKENNIQQQTTDDEAALDTAHPEPPSSRTRVLYVDLNATTGKIYTNPTGIFLTPSISGHQYMIVFYEYNDKYIHSEPKIDRKGPSIIVSYKKAVQYFESRGFKPLL
jgi:hypothetical protein